MAFIMRDDFDTSQCPMYPVVRYPCCEIDQFIDGFLTIFVGIGAAVPLMAIFSIPVAMAALKKVKMYGEHCKGVVLSKRNWVTVSHGKNSSHTHQHYAMTVKYPAEGARLGMAEYEVTKEFVVSESLSQSKFESQEIDIVRMPKRMGFDPRKSFISGELEKTEMNGGRSGLVVTIFFFTVWNVMIFQVPWCATNLWAWPLAFLGAAYSAYKAHTTFDSTGIEGSITRRGESAPVYQAGMNGTNGMYMTGSPMQMQMQPVGLAPPSYDAEIEVAAHPYANKRPSISGYTDTQQTFSISGSMRNLGAQAVPMAVARAFQPAHPEDHYHSQGGGGDGKDLAGEIAKLAELKSQGVLTEEEFQQGKKQLLGM